MHPLTPLLKVIAFVAFGVIIISMVVGGTDEKKILSSVYRHPRPEVEATKEYAIKGITVYVTESEFIELNATKLVCLCGFATLFGLGVAEHLLDRRK